MQGSCECGAVRFESQGPWRDVINCHCTQCRKTSGHHWAATAVPNDSLKIENDDALVWYESSDRARRGFCMYCGSSLFYQRHDTDQTAIGAGCLEPPTGLKTTKDIFVEDKGDYYSVGGSPLADNSTDGPVTGSCECGGVMVEVSEPPLYVWACHCEQCRKASGHFWVGAQLAEGGYRITNDATLNWYQSTDVVKKGYCDCCGGTVFWWLDGRYAPAVSAGVLDNPTGIRIEKHIFLAEKSDYYDIEDDLPQAQLFDLDVTGGE